MAAHLIHHTPHGHNASFTTPTALMLDARLTPLERNGWQVLRMLRSAEGISPLANLGQLRRYLTSTPLEQRAGYETAATPRRPTGCVRCRWPRGNCARPVSGR